MKTKAAAANCRCNNDSLLYRDKHFRESMYPVNYI